MKGSDRTHAPMSSYTSARLLIVPTVVPCRFPRALLLAASVCENTVMASRSLPARVERGAAAEGVKTPALLRLASTSPFHPLKRFESHAAASRTELVVREAKILREGQSRRVSFPSCP